MYKDEFNAVAKGATAKVRLLKTNPLGYVLMSVLAGMYIGFGILLVFTLSGSLAGAPYTKLVMGCCFGVALSLVVIPGAELFTGNNLVMTAGMLRKTIKLADAIKLWVVCWLGNLVGSVLIAYMFHVSGLYGEATVAAVSGAAVGKMSAGFMPLLCRAILCNMLVCLAIWSGFRTKSDAAKLIMVFWCLLAFFATGFEHSIANMTTLTLALLNNTGDAAITFGGYWYNLAVVTLGNMIGGIIFVALPYHVTAKDVQ